MKRGSLLSVCVEVLGATPLNLLLNLSMRSTVLLLSVCVEVLLKSDFIFA